MKTHNSKLKTVVVFLILNFALLTLSSAKVHAINMESSRYRIQMGNINIGAADQSSDNFNLSTTMGQTAAGQFNSDGYVVKAGFQYIHSIIPFRFTISKTQIDFGTIVSNTFYTDTADLSVSFGGAGQYQVTTEELGPMSMLTGGNTIPDTICNGGGSTCTVSVANTWNDTSKDGFGYNMAGMDVPADFSSSSHFRPFPDTTAGGVPAIIMSNSNVGVGRTSTIKFQVNVSNTQAAGTYQTILRFTATPTF